MRLLNILLLLQLACAVEPRDGMVAREAEWSTGPSTSSADDETSTTDAAEFVAPNCEDGKELERVACDYRLTGSSSGSACEVKRVMALPDDEVSVRAVQKEAACKCEFNSPGKTGNEAASCVDFSAGYSDPNVGASTCGPKNQSTAHTEPLPEATAIGATFELASAAALADCEAAVAKTCAKACAKAKARLLRNLGGAISCCVPSSEASDEPDADAGPDADAEPDDAEPGDAEPGDAEPGDAEPGHDGEPDADASPEPA